MQYLKLCSSLDEAQACFLDPLELNVKELVFLPVNNNLDKLSAGGSHWSLLVFVKETRKFLHLDSMDKSNQDEAVKFYEKYKGYFRATKFEHAVTFPRQVNSSDCGVYVLGDFAYRSYIIFY